MNDGILLLLIFLVSLLAAGDAPESQKRTRLVSSVTKRTARTGNGVLDDTLAILVNRPAVVSNHDPNNWARNEN
jgi:hypothetical protein